MFKLSIAAIRELISKGYLGEAFSEIMNNRIKWTEWNQDFIAKYLADQLGRENICKLCEAINSKRGSNIIDHAFFDKRFLSKRRLKALEKAYELYCRD
jgi:hypothetical protein